MAAHQTMSYGKRTDDRRRGGPMGKEEYTTTYATKGDKERMSREKPKVDTKRLAALRSKDKKDPSVSASTKGCVCVCVCVCVLYRACLVLPVFTV